jgi:hypothetical protein
MGTDALDFWARLIEAYWAQISGFLLYQSLATKTLSYILKECFCACMSNHTLVLAPFSVANE